MSSISAHDYSEEDLSQFFKRLLIECPRLLAIEKLLSQTSVHDKILNRSP